MGAFFFSRKNIHKHPFHLVNSSLWPFSLALSLFNFFLILIAYFNNFFVVSIVFNFISSAWVIYSPVLYFLVLLFFLSRWVLDIIRESTFEGFHTVTVQLGIYFGMLLFVLSEIMFFF